MCISVLKRCHLFRGLSDSEIESVLGRTPHATQIFEKDEPVFRLMDAADRVGVILNGRVQAQKIFVRVASSTWVSRPMTVSHSIIPHLHSQREQVCASPSPADRRGRR